MANSLKNLVAPLENLTVVEITGADAATFLHSQLTNDIANLAPGSACLAGYCTAKGRLLASLVVWRPAQQPCQTFYALIRKDIAEATIKHLSMFVLRSKVKLEITGQNVFGVVLPRGTALSATPPRTPAQADLLAGAMPTNLPTSAAPYCLLQSPEATWIAAPTARAEESRWWVINRKPGAIETSQGKSGSTAWQAADIAAGLPWVTAATQDIFIPQTLNLDLIDGISFTKGCYPGQEIVARSHYRGTVKRRMVYGVVNAMPSSLVQDVELPGVDIYNALRPDSPCGRVVNAAYCGTRTHLLLEIQLTDLGSADFRLKAATGAQIGIQPLPYLITA
jgi:folate-binding protein YgfZ